ncbi:MAG: hypothetical protein K2R98_08590 [Gemmataceae bacterium]|nr:hypothetical protein [Gemmataceae bacterium]
MISLGWKWTLIPIQGGRAWAVACSTGAPCRLIFRKGERPAVLMRLLDVN